MGRSPGVRVERKMLGKLDERRQCRSARFGCQTDTRCSPALLVLIVLLAGLDEAAGFRAFVAFLAAGVCRVMAAAFWSRRRKVQAA
jgi:hypothetical protein